MAEKLKIEFPSQGWKQFLTSRHEILDAYDRAKERAKSHEVETYHGRVAEAQLRNWLSGFLPKKYGVTSGYIVSPGLRHDQKTPHYDVIIYDSQNSPVLWIEGDPDRSEQGRSIAIPVEHVQCVLEVKSRFSSSTAAAAIEHLKDLQPLMGGIDDPKERYKLHLPANFVCGLIFFELRKEDEFSSAALSRIIDGVGLRGFFGGLILRGQGHDRPVSGRLHMLRSETPTEEGDRRSLLSGMSIAKSIKVADDFHISAAIMWVETNFAQFAFDLIALMHGTYEPGRISSFYGLGAENVETQW
jgi:hypothetical protein